METGVSGLISLLTKPRSVVQWVLEQMFYSDTEHSPSVAGKPTRLAGQSTHYLGGCLTLGAAP